MPLIRKIFATCILIFLTFTSIIARFSITHLVTDAKPNTTHPNTDETRVLKIYFGGYFYALSSCIWIPEAFHFLYALYQYIQARKGRNFSDKFKTWKQLILSHYAILVIADCLQLFSQILLILIIYPNVDVVTACAFPFLSFLVPLGLQCVTLKNEQLNLRGFLKRMPKVLENSLPFFGLFSNIGVYICIILAYSETHDKTYNNQFLNFNAVVLVSIVIYPIFSSVSFFRNWIDFSASCFNQNPDVYYENDIYDENFSNATSISATSANTFNAKLSQKKAAKHREQIEQQLSSYSAFK